MAYPHEQIPMQQKQPFLVQQPGPTLGMQMGGGGNRNAAGKPLNSSGEREWSNGLCGCFEECGTCCYALWCPCVVHGKNKQRLDHLNNKGFPHPDGGDCCSGSCWGHCCLSGLGFGWLLQVRSHSIGNTALITFFRIVSFSVLQPW
ncbi:unnamed protein product [Mycena citricolor]|uniref:Uncharacterized protein n=1 Tax=Mycena citricolor TaxID=2018698 RepID=A0AAD2HBS4_9AGAR|nr:unnamed protein product [Mycena citricolor]